MGAYIAGVGMTKVGRHFDLGLSDLAFQAVKEALSNAGASIEEVDMLVVSSTFSQIMGGQTDLSTILAQELGITIPTLRVEAGEASGAVALKVASDAVASHASRAVLVVGVEKMTEFPSDKANSALSSILNYEAEGIKNIAPVNYAALAMKEYMRKYGVSREDLFTWAVKMHENALNNPYAHLRFRIKPEALQAAQIISTPITLYDMHPLSDGSAAALIVSDSLKDSFSSKCIELTDIEGASSPPYYMRDDFTSLPSLREAYQILKKRTGFEATPDAAIEVHDSFSIYGVISLEELGLAGRGKGVEVLNELDNINVGGGLKARGHPVGATPLYQLAESVHMLRGGFAGKTFNGDEALIHSMSGPDNASWVLLLRRC
ncbi:MAG: hypothetical protein J7L55_01720 [Desulfurococcales archaeon]|nr:hypothetical protein [Desulfurococcales archaeon]